MTCLSESPASSSHVRTSATVDTSHRASEAELLQLDVMSLFGTSPDDPSATKQSSLFEDRPTPGAGGSQSSLLADDRPAPAEGGSHSSLFADDEADDTSSPWRLSTPKKPSRSELVKSILPSSDVPELYIDIYDTLLESEGLGSGVSLAGVRRVLEGSGLPAEVQSRILNITLPEGAENAESAADGVSQGQISVLLTLIGLAQEDDDVTLDGVDERKRSRWPLQVHDVSDRRC